MFSLAVVRKCQIDKHKGKDQPPENVGLQLSEDVGNENSPENGEPREEDLASVSYVLEGEEHTPEIGESDEKNAKQLSTILLIFCPTLENSRFLPLLDFFVSRFILLKCIITRTIASKAELTKDTFRREQEPRLVALGVLE